MRILLTHGIQQLLLSGSSGDSVFRSARLLPAAGEPFTYRGQPCQAVTVELLLEGAPEIIDSALEQVSLILDEAGRQPPAPKVLLTASRAGGGDWSARVLAGRLELTGGAADREQGVQQARLALVCRVGWRGAWANLPLSNINGSRVTGGLLVNNHSDSAHHGYVEINRDDITGGMPGYFILEISHPSGAAEPLGSVYLGLDTERDLNLLPLVLEGESAAAAGAAWTVNANSASSGGADGRAAWSAAGETALADWTLSGSFLSNCRGRVFRLLLRLGSANTVSGLQLGLKIMSAGGDITYEETQPVPAAVGGQLIELPALHLPPIDLGDEEQYGDLRLRLYARRETSGSAQLAVDFLQFLPLEGFRKLAALTSLDPGCKLIDDGVDEVTVGQTAAGGRIPSHTALGQRLALTPGCDHRLWILQDAAANAQLSVRVFHLPLRRTL